MPVREYSCRTCGHRFEILERSMNEGSSSSTCPACNGKQLERLLSVFAAHQGNSEPSIGSQDCPRCAGGPCQGLG